MNYIGIDLSLSSPGFCIYNEKMYSFYFFSDKKKLNNFKHIDSQNNFYINFSPPTVKNDDIDGRIQRYKEITDDIINTVYHLNTNSLVGIESYSYGSVGQGVTKLVEIGGILRYKLVDLKFKIKECPPTQIKKFFTGKGNATKWMMYQQMKQSYNIDLCKILDSHLGKNFDVPHPVEDLVDSFAIIQLLRETKTTPVNFVDSIMDNFTKGLNV